MRVFLSWSGQQSRSVALALRDWLPSVLQSVEPWLSGEDIAAGARWFTEITKALEESRIGIICLTPENVDSAWIHFEAGALARLDNALLCVYAVGISLAEVKMPLAQFQMTRADRDDTFRLVTELNRKTEKPLAEAKLADAFELWWPRLEQRLSAIAVEGMSVPSDAKPQDQIGEILSIVQDISRRLPSATSAPSAVAPQAAPNAKPRLFIASSTEGLPIAEAIQVGLDDAAECTLWTQGAFNLSETVAESIVNAPVKYDFAVLVFTPDDVVEKRGERRSAPRDNLLFELGLFTGALGRARTFMVYSRDASMHFPSDLMGVTAAQYSERSDGNWQAAVGPVCTRIKRAMGVA